jgi:5-dehydro-4-deoxyglucarate dehydratase
MEFDGVLFFPVTPFGADGEVAPAVLREHVAAGMAHRPGGVFAACGTGEFSSLDAGEIGVVTRTVVETVDGRVPVLAGAGGSVRQAKAAARAAEEAGADGLLLLPPYLVAGPQAGLQAYVEQVAEASGLPIVLYHRANARFTPDTVARLARDARIIGVKDGVGDLALAQQLVLAARSAGRRDLLFFNGLLTAEMTQAAYRAIGIPLYSSAVFAAAPAIATAFYSAYAAHDDERCRDLLTAFYAPFVHLRDRAPGYAISLIKAAVRESGLPVGPVRPPLADPTPEDLAELRRLLAVGRDLVGG